MARLYSENGAAERRGNSDVAERTQALAVKVNINSAGGVLKPHEMLSNSIILGLASRPVRRRRIYVTPGPMLEKSKQEAGRTHRFPQFPIISAASEETRIETVDEPWCGISMAYEEAPAVSAVVRPYPRTFGEGGHR